MPDPEAALTAALSEEPDGPACVELSLECPACGGTGTDPAAPMPIAGVTQIEEVRCKECLGARRVRRWASLSALTDYLTASLVGRLPRVLRAVKEEAVRDLMES